MIDDSSIMSRCLQLAQNGNGFVAPNPMVGAVLVYDGKIIGEGFHQAFGEPHAEVNAINQSIENGNGHLLNKSVLYVNLEPCSHSGKTPPCTELIVEHRIPKVVIGCKDLFPEVNGRGIKKLREAGIIVETGILEKECMEFNIRFNTFHAKKRPFIILKYAQTSNHFIAPIQNKNKKISNDYTDILVHRWRSEEAAIMVGTKTAELDNPSLTVRKWKGKNPVRVLIDRKLRLPKSLSLFDGSSSTLVFNEIRNEIKNNIEFIRIDFNENVISNLISFLYERKILSLIVEGGRNLLGQFIENKLWDEARIITSDNFFAEGIRSPEIHGKVISSSNVTGNNILILHSDIN